MTVLSRPCGSHINHRVKCRERLASSILLSERADRVDFDARVRLEVKGAQIRSDDSLPVMRERDGALGLSDWRQARCATCDAARTLSIISKGCSGNRCSALGRIRGCHQSVNEHRFRSSEVRDATLDPGERFKIVSFRHAL